MNRMQEKNSETFDFIQFFIKYFKTFFITTLSAVALSIIVTFFIPKEYLSVGIIFPTSSNSLQATVENPVLGYDVEADRLIQIMQSREMLEIVTKEINLVQHFGIDTTKKDWYDNLRKTFNSSVTFKRKLSMSIEITAQTTDPELSAKIVNTIIDNIDNIRERIIKQNSILAYESYAKEYNQKKKMVDSLVAVITSKRDTFNDPQFNIMMDSKMLNISSLKSSSKNSTQLELDINNYYYEQSYLNEINKRYEKAKANVFSNIPQIYILDRANISYKKVFPSYTVNALLNLFTVFLITFFFLFVKEKIKTNNK